MSQLFFFLSLFFLLPFSLSATTRTVCASGCDHTTISSAIGAAADGDIIDIQDNVHTEDNIAITKSLTIQGQGQTTTIVQAHAMAGMADDGVFKILSPGLTVVFQNLTIQNGKAEPGSGSTLDAGGGVYINCDALTDIQFNQVNILNNASSNNRGGGVNITGANGTISFNNCLISNNIALGENGDGGGISNRGASTFTMTKCTVSNNTAGDDGGGIYVFEAGSTNKFINCTIHSNAAGGQSTDEGRGAGLYLASNSSFDVLNCTIVENTLAAGINQRGSGIYNTSNSILNLTNTIVANNSGANEGNDIYSANTTTVNQISSLVEACAGNCPEFSYFGDPNLAAVSTCGVHEYFPTNARSLVSDKGTPPSGDIPTDDICGNNRTAGIYDIGSYDDNLVTSAPIEITDNIENYFSKIIDYLPEEGLDNFVEPSTNDLVTWEAIIDDLLAGNTAAAHSKAIGIDYEIVLFTDNTLVPHQQFYVLQKEAAGSNFWGTYAFHPSPCREIIIQSPHPKKDTNTGKQGIYCFKNTATRAFMLSGTHRCNAHSSSACSGTTSACLVDGPFKKSDLSHNDQTCFQTTSNKLHDDIANSVLIQLHGFSMQAGDPYVILSNGTSFHPSSTDYAANFETHLAATDGSLTFQVGHLDNWTRLIGTTNTQGRYINGESMACTNAASAATGRFIHLEQEKTKLRDNETGWNKVATAIENLLPCSILPNELLDFKASLNDETQIELTWVSSAEYDLAGYEIERSQNGRDWALIGFVGGENNFLELTSYQFLDSSPWHGKNYYRLKPIDWNGQFKYSNLVEITFLPSKKSTLNAFPNPTNGILLVQADEGQAVLYNILGQAVLQFSIENNETQKIGLEALEKGTYLLVVQNQQGQKDSQVIIYQ